MGLSWQHLLVVLVIALLVFGTRKLRNIGKDLGGAVKDFKKEMREDEDPPPRKRVTGEDRPDADFDEKR